MTAPRKRLFLLVFIVGIFIAAFLAWKGFAYRHHLRFVPEAMNVWWVQYVSEEAWGFGPGGNETGIIVYDMPEKVRQELEEKGPTWLEALPRNSWDGWQGGYSDWHSTPIPKTHSWADPAACPPKTSDRYLGFYPNGCPSISGYMGAYGFAISFDRDVEDMVNEALFSPGAYYAFGRIGILILIPAHDRIVYVYNG
jgi:hypothetical protein